MSSGGVVTIGETMALMSTPGFGMLQHSATLDLGIGGSESNVAIALQRLGATATWIGKVGTDSLGDLVLREIGAEGVRVVGVRDDSTPTGLMIKERRTSIDTRVWYYRKGNAGSRLSVDDVDFGLIEDAAILHVTGISPALSVGLATVILEAVRVARVAGVTVSFDLNFRRTLWSREDAAEFYRTIIPLADIVFAGDDEAAIAVGECDDPVELAHRIGDLGATEAVIKLGAAGAVASINDQDFVQHAVAIAPVDTVGAGDAFVAGYLADRLLGADVPTRLATAATVGAYNCLTLGDWEGLPRRHELAALTATEQVSR